jgi:hypothetical protein
MINFTPKTTISGRNNYRETIISNDDFTYGYWSQLIDHMLDYGFVMREMFSFVDTKSVMITFSFIDQYENI